MVYLENPPAYEALEDEFAWEKTYAAEKKRRFKEEPVLSRVSAIAKWARLNLKKPRVVKTGASQLSQLRRLFPNEESLVLVDVGCGYGDKAERIADMTRVPTKPVGVEVSLALAENANQRLRRFGGYCVQKPAVEGMGEFSDDSVHLVVLSSFLEHEVQPVELLTACGRKLAPGGRVIIKVPNFGSLNRQVRKERWCGFRYPDHVNYFTPKTLRATVEKAGLAVQRMGFMDRMPTSDNMWLIAERPRG